MHDSLTDMSKVGCTTDGLLANMRRTWAAMQEAGGGRPDFVAIHPSWLQNDALMAELRAAAANHNFSIRVEGQIA